MGFVREALCTKQCLVHWDCCMALAVFSMIMTFVCSSLSLIASSMYGVLPVRWRMLCSMLYICHLIIPISKMGKLSLKMCNGLSASPAAGGLRCHP